MSQTTKRAIAASLKKLLETTPLSKITIADIAEDCCISRMTFYYHFQDIYDLVKWICFDEGSRALSCMADGASWQEGFRSLCSCVLENRAFYVTLCRVSSWRTIFTARCLGCCAALWSRRPVARR